MINFVFLEGLRHLHQTAAHRVQVPDKVDPKPLENDDGVNGSGGNNKEFSH